MMAEGGRRKRSTKDDDLPQPGLGTFLAAGALAAGIGALAYGAKKLYDYVNTEQPEQCKTLPDEGGYYPPPPPPPRREERLSAGPSSGAPGPSALAHSGPKPGPATPQRSLAQCLDEYYRDYVAVTPGELQDAQQVVDDIRNSLSAYLRQNHPELSLCALSQFGSACEDLQVISAGSFDVLLPVELSGDMWELVKAAELGIDSPGSYCIRRRNMATNPLGSHPYDNKLDASFCLLMDQVSLALNGPVEDAVTHIQKYNMKMKSGLSVDVTYTASEAFKYLTINMFPAMILQGELVISKARLSPAREAECQKLWQKSFSYQEAESLRIFNPRRSCHLKCLKIMKAIRLNHPAHFGVFPSYVYKTILLHMLAETPEEDLWQEECLQEQFVDMLNQVIYYLQGRKLPNFYDSSVNLLDGIPVTHCDNLVTFITSSIGKEKLPTLLEQNFQPAIF